MDVYKLSILRIYVLSGVRRILLFPKSGLPITQGLKCSNSSYGSHDYPTSIDMKIKRYGTVGSILS